MLLKKIATRQHRFVGGSMEEQLESVEIEDSANSGSHAVENPWEAPCSSTNRNLWARNIPSTSKVVLDHKQVELPKQKDDQRLKWNCAICKCSFPSRRAMSKHKRQCTIDLFEIHADGWASINIE